MITFLEGLEMEKRIKKCAEEILMQHPHARSVEFHGGEGLRTEITKSGVFDILGIDASLHLVNYESLKVQLKCGTLENFEQFGKPRQSFVLGAFNDVVMERVIDTPIKMYDLMLTGYETRPGVMDPYCLISWPHFLKRVHGSSKIVIQRETNSRNGSVFAWAWAGSIARCNVACGNIFHYEEFGPFDKDPMEEKK